MAFDSDEQFEMLYKLFYNKLNKEYNKFKINNPHLQEMVIKEEFSNKINHCRNQLVGNSYQNTNDFINDIVNKFQDIHLRYKSRPIYHFLISDLPKHKKYHKELYTFGSESKRYSYKPDFINSASDYQIIKLLAKNKAYLKIREFIDKTNSSELQGTRNSEESGHIYTRARQALAITYTYVALELDEEYTNRAALGRLAHLYSAKDITSIIDNSPIYKKVKKIFNKSERYTNQDLIFVKNHFEDLKSDSPHIKRIIELIKNDIKNYK